MAHSKENPPLMGQTPETEAMRNQLTNNAREYRKRFGNLPDHVGTPGLKDHPTAAERLIWMIHYALDGPADVATYQKILADALNGGSGALPTDSDKPVAVFRQSLVDANAKLGRVQGRLATLVGICGSVADALEASNAYMAGVLREGMKKAEE